MFSPLWVLRDQDNKKKMLGEGRMLKVNINDFLKFCLKPALSLTIVIIFYFLSNARYFWYVTSLNIIMTLWDWNYNSHFTEEETGV